MINAGLTGYITFQHLIYLNETLYEYQPDMVVFLDGQNDFYITRQNFNAWLDYGYSSTGLIKIVNRPTQMVGAYFLAKSLAGHSHFAYLVYHTLHTRYWRGFLAKQATKMIQHVEENTIPFAELSEKYPALAATSYMRAYRQIETLNQVFGFKMMVFLQPHASFENPEILSPTDQRIRKITVPNLNGQKTPMMVIRDLAPEIFADAGIPFHYLGSIGSKSDQDKQLYLDYCHLTPLGSLRFAEKMASRLWPDVNGGNYSDQ